MPDLTLAAIIIRRRTAVIALFRKTGIEDILVRELSSDLQKAENSVTGFLRQTLERHHIELVAMENVEHQTARIQQLHKQAESVLRAEGMPIQEVPLAELFQSFAIPPLRQRSQLRRIARSIWPALNDRRLGQVGSDAAALGLYLQTERLFNLNSPQS